MTESTIITGQFVRISQTPASIGERLMALIIDYFLIGLYILSTITLLSKLSLPSGFSLFFFLCVVYLPILGYSFLCEMFNHGQSFGKKLINIRVVKVDGSTPSIGSYLLRWLLFPIDGPITSGLGLLVVLLNKNNQRLGDLAAGTMVIKEKNSPKAFICLLALSTFTTVTSALSLTGCSFSISITDFMTSDNLPTPDGSIKIRSG